MSDVHLPVIVVLDNIRSLYNTGAFFRTADACGIERLVLCGITPRPDQGGRQARAIAKTALGAEAHVPWTYEPNATEAVARLQTLGYHVAVAETSPQAVDVFDWSPPWPLCLVFGHETAGVGSGLQAHVPTHVRVPMHGHKHSLNVATAAGVLLYELLRKRRGLSGGSP